MKPLAITTVPRCKRCGFTLSTEQVEEGREFCDTCQTKAPNAGITPHWDQATHVEPTITKMGGGPNLPSV